MARKEDKTTIQVSISMRNQLMMLKLFKELESMDEVINMLMKGYHENIVKGEG